MSCRRGNEGQPYRLRGYASCIRKPNRVSDAGRPNINRDPMPDAGSASRGLALGADGIIEEPEKLFGCRVIRPARIVVEAAVIGVALAKGTGGNIGPLQGRFEPQGLRRRVGIA